MSIHNLFLSKIRIIMYTPLNPSLTILKWDLRGSKLYRRVVLCVLVGLMGKGSHPSKTVISNNAINTSLETCVTKTSTEC